MKPHLTLTEADPSQAAAVSDLVNSAFRGDSSRKGWTTEADLLGGQRSDPLMIEEVLLNPSKKLLLAFEGVELLGCVTLEKVGIYARLGMLTVAPNRQAAGLGKAILQAAEKWASVHWFAVGIELFVVRQRQELIDWYVRRGYELRPERHPFPYGDARFGLPKVHDLEFVVLRKIFPPSAPS